MMRKRSGFTLVEVIAVVITTGILAAMLHMFFLGAWVNFETELTRIDLAQEAAQIFRIVEEDVLEAETLVRVDAAHLQIDFPIPEVINPSSASSAPIFTAPLTASGNFKYTQVVYQLSGSQLVRTGTPAGAGSVLVLSGRIAANTGFSIEGSLTQARGKRLTLNLALEEPLFNRTITYQKSKDIVARN